MTTSSWKVRATQASSPTYPDPLKMQAGDAIELAGQEEDGWIWCRHTGGKEGWVPLSYLSAGGEGNSHLALQDYDAIELPVEVGEEFEVVQEESGWLWGINAQGKWGWIRLANVERVDEA